MKYYCKNCKSKFALNYELLDENKCPFCFERGFVIKIPEYETIEQYLQRTGEEWNGAIWFRIYLDTARGWDDWFATEVNTIKVNKHRKHQAVCADGNNPPPYEFELECKKGV